MKKLPSFVSAEPSAARASDRPPEPELLAWWKVFRWGILFTIVAPFLFWNGCILLGWGTLVTIDRLKGPLHLEAAVRVASPDNRIRFEADTDGKMRLVQIATGKVIHERQIPVGDYRKIDADWKDNRNVNVVCYIRYPALSNSSGYVWDSKSGAFKDPYSGKTVKAE